jgi:hypothetical protein
MTRSLAWIQQLRKCKAPMPKPPQVSTKPVMREVVKIDLKLFATSREHDQKCKNRVEYVIDKIIVKE